MAFVVFAFVVLTMFSMNLRTSQATSHVTLHQEWMTQFSREYKNESEKQMRYKVFKNNLKYIENFNKKGNQSYKLGINEFSDWTTEEFFATHTDLNLINKNSRSEVVDDTIPYLNWKVNNVFNTNKDWRDEGAVTPVKSKDNVGYQGCWYQNELLININIYAGSCWAFAVTAAVEGLIKIAGGKLVSLSEQQLIDCVKSDAKNDGCKGRDMGETYTYIAKNKGIASANAYPYQMKVGQCMSNAAPAARIRNFTNVPTNNELALLAAVWGQPISAAISAKNPSFFQYKGGVYDDRNCGTSTNHAMTLVGYGTTREGIKYWLAKNSWGTTWGENGYMRLRRDVEWPEGMCGVAQFANYPLA